MSRDRRAAIVALALFSALTGVVYPLVVTGIARLAFPFASRGSLIHRGTTLRGSALIGQAFTTPQYLWGRPSAIAIPYDARASSGSNLGPTNPTLDSLVRTRVAALRAADSTVHGTVPVDLVTASGSGLDPHVTIAAALLQIRRIALARGLDSVVVSELVRAHIEPRTFGFLGEPRVNVLRVNLSLDSLSGSPERSRR